MMMKVMIDVVLSMKKDHIYSKVFREIMSIFYLTYVSSTHQNMKNGFGFAYKKNPIL